MSFGLKIRVARGFEPAVDPSAIAPTEPDPDRTEEEERLWQRQREERAREAAWEPFAMTVSMGGMALVIEVLTRAGAVFTGTTAPEGKRLPRGPNGEVDARKLGSNDGWVLSAAECRFVGTRLAAWLDRGGGGPEHREALMGLAAFFARAGDHNGLKVS
jgi:hypothetical protein